MKTILIIVAVYLLIGLLFGIFATDRKLSHVLQTVPLWPLMIIVPIVIIVFVSRWRKELDEKGVNP